MRRVDGNQAAIVKALREAGCSVQLLSQVGRGCPDALVGFQHTNTLLEFKDPAQKPSMRRLTPAEADWHQKWNGQVAIVETLEEALRIVGIDITRGTA